MDVICDRCKAEYEFDETLLGERGTTVKCSACGHVFRVMPPSRDAGRAQLKLRYARDGSVQPLASLRELQQRIRDGEVSLDDELGRDGFPFRALRDVPELRNFFARTPERTTVRPDVEAAGASAPGDQVGTRPPPPPAERDLEEAAAAALAASAWASTPESDGSTPSRAEQAAHRTMMGVGPLDAPPPPRAPSPAQATLGPAAAMAGSQAPEPLPPPARAAVEASERPPAPAATLLGTPARDFGLNGRPAPSGPAFPDDEDVPPTPSASPPRYDVVPPARAASFAASLPPPSAAPAYAGASYAPASRSGYAPAASVRAPAAERVQLYLEDDDPLPMRSLGGSSRIWIVLLLLVLIAGGGWLGLQALKKRGSEAEAAMAPTSTAPDAGAIAPGEPLIAAAPTPEPSAPQAPAAAVKPATPASAQPSPAAHATSTPATPAAKPSTRAKAPAPPKPDKPSASAEPKDEPARPAVRERPSTPEPEDYSAWVARGDQLNTRGDREGASQAYRTALGLRPAGSEANTGLGFALLAQGQAREALPYFDRAASSGYAEASIGLGDAYRKLGQPSSAIEAYQAYLDRLPNGARASYARSALEKLSRGGGEAEATPRGGEAYKPAGELTEPAPPPSPNADPSEPPP